MANPNDPEGSAVLRSSNSTERFASCNGMLLALGVVSLLAVTLVATLPDMFMPYDPQARVAEALLAPTFSHPFGTDEIGRDLMSRVILGTRYTWIPGLVVIGVSFIVGTTIGLTAAILGGWTEAVLERITEVLFMVPSMLLAVAMAAVLGPSIEHSVMAIAAWWWPWYAWIARDEFRRIRALPHYQGAVAAGATRFRLVYRYGLPGVVPALVVASAVDISNVVMTLSLLSFLGLGQPDPAPELGALVSRSMDSLTVFWWLPILPALTIFLICFAANTLGDGLRLALKGR